MIDAGAGVGGGKEKRGRKPSGDLWSLKVGGGGARPSQGDCPEKLIV